MWSTAIPIAALAVMIEPISIQIPTQPIRPKITTAGKALGAIAVMLYGTYITATLPVDILPDLNRPTVTIFTEAEGFANIKKATDKAIRNGYKVIGLSASSQEVTEALTKKYQLNFNFYFCDETALKTVVRSNPSLIELQKGTIIQKLHWNDVSKLKLSNNK